MKRINLKKALIYISVAIVVLFGLVQAIPYGRDHSNPPVTNDVVWSSAQAKSLFTKACADCHSNETVWPWYSNVAPVSWLVQKDVDDGRDELNISVSSRGANEMASSVREGEMPPLQYKLAHPGSRLSATDKQLLIEGLQATFGAAAPRGSRN